MAKKYEIRDPIHGFIHINEWEREIINHPAFQRLRRIRQLSLADMVYPGAMHTRFEHSLGVMHVAEMMFDKVVENNKKFLKEKLFFNDHGIEKDKVLLRLAGLLHDIGHAPFSHVGEDLMPIKKKNERYKHEDYSAAIIKYILKDVIEDHNLNQNYDIKAEDVSNFLTGNPTVERSLLWRGIVSSQLDADRADYLLRDSYHAGVAYGKYDLPRLLNTLTIAIDENDSPILAVEKGGWHVAESLIIARYMMFTQVYFQHTVSAFSHHISKVMKKLLIKESKKSELQEEGKFLPPTTKENVEAYLKWNDWKVLGLINSERGGKHGKYIKERSHFKRIYETKEIPDLIKLEEYDMIISKLKESIDEDNFFGDEAEKLWYNMKAEEIMIYCGNDRDERKDVEPLSSFSSIVKNIKPIKKKRVFIFEKDKEEAEQIIKNIRKEKV